MLKRIQTRIHKNQGTIAIALVILGILVYAAKSIRFAHTIPSTNWDEGMYLYKGFLFISGKFVPFADGGPWTNQMPIAYFLPGLSQIITGPGIRPGRYFAVFLGVLTLIGLALAANRLSGKWWAVFVVWTVSLNNGWIKSFSLPYSQVVVSFFFAWALFFLFGKNKKIGELTAAAFFASLAAMTRINVLPFVVLLIGYVLWQHGKKPALWAVFGAAIPIVFFHWLYWPDILKIWAYWIPPEAVPQLDYYRSPWHMVFRPPGFSWLPVSAWLSNPSNLAWEILGYLVDALRANFVIWTGVLATALILLQKDTGQTTQAKKRTVFLLFSFVVLMIVHMWASLGGNSCQFSCLVGYMLFFNCVGLFAFISAASSIQPRFKTWAYVVLVSITLLTLIGFEYRLQDSFRDVRYALVTKILKADEVRLNNPETHLEPETNRFWSFLKERLHYDRYYWYRFLWKNEFFTRVLWWVIPIFLVFVLPWATFKLFDKLNISTGSYTYFISLSLITLISILGSNTLFVQPMDTVTCDTDVLLTYEQTGEALRRVIPPDAQIFWDVKSNIPLLYIPDAKPFLPQINYRFTYINQPDANTEELIRFSWWNQELGETWIEQADYIVTENRFYRDLWNWEDRVNSGKFDIILTTEAIDTCTGSDSELIVLKPYP